MHGHHADATPADASLATDRARRLDAVIDAALAEKRIVGTVLLVAEDGAIVYRRAAGFADREAGKPVAEDTIFRLASVTKPMVAVTALALAEDGVIGLDDPVTRHLPGFRPKLRDGSEPVITIRHLLSHTSGLHYGYPPEADISEGLDRPGRGMAENLAKIAAQPLAFAPGAAWAYSVGIDVLGGLLEKATGKSLPELVAEKVATPLGLRDTAFRVTAPERLAVAYGDGKPEPVPIRDGATVGDPSQSPVFWPGRIFNQASFPSGGAGMAGTAPEFLRFLEAIRSGGAPLLPPASLPLLTEPTAPRLDDARPGRGFSLGWSLYLDPVAADGPFSPGSWQWGGVYGHSWFVDPARRLSVVSFTNTAFAGVGGPYPQAVADAVYG